MKRFVCAAMWLLAVVTMTGRAEAAGLSGVVACDINGNGQFDGLTDPRLPGITARVVGVDISFLEDVVSDAQGLFHAAVPTAAHTYQVSLVGVSVPILLPAVIPVVVTTSTTGAPATPIFLLDGSACRPNLRVSKTPDAGTFEQGAQVSFTIVVSNPAGGAATNVQLNDQLPGNGGLAWASVTTSQGSCTLTGSLLQCALGTLPAGGSATVVVASTPTTPLAACQAQPNPVARATADGGLSAEDAGSMTCTPPPQNPHLSVTKTPDTGTFTQGSQLSFMIVVASDGDATATNVRLRDQLPSNGGLLWVTASTTHGTCTISASNLLECSFGDLFAGTSATVIVATTQTTPGAACQTQPNPVALATADGGLMAQDAGDLSCTPPPLPCPAGYFAFRTDSAGNLVIIFDQFPAPNDNSYGVNSVGWRPNRPHRFSDLVGSDHAGFQLVDPGGVVRLSFNIDYISANAAAPSGYASLGPFGGDGRILVGSLTPADISYTSSLANNLNNINIPGLFNAAHQQLIGSVNVLVDSPPTDAAHQTYNNSDPALMGWDFHNTYFVTISAAKLASLGFTSAWRVEPNLDALHNSPAKACPPEPATGTGLSVTKLEVKDKNVKITLSNTATVGEIISAIQLTWPLANGRLTQVKLGGDVIYDNPDIAAPSANLTLAELVADARKRTIQQGRSEVLQLTFERNASFNLADYTGTISTGSFGLTILP